jgi:hypothetical protein
MKKFEVYAKSAIILQLATTPLPQGLCRGFEIANGSTKVNISTQANVVNFFQMDERIVEKKLKKQLKENLAMLKDLLETKQVLPAS